MADLSALRQAALDHLSLPARAKPDLGGAGLGLGERRFQGAVNLRARRDDPAAREALSAALGCALPATGGSVQAGQLTLLAIGPDEWLAIGGGAEAERLRQACAGQFVGVTDVGENWCSLVVSGPAARTVLTKGCPLDLHPRRFKPGDVAGTLVAKATVVLLQEAEERYLLLVRRSFADYLFRWLEDAGREVGVAVIES